MATFFRILKDKPYLIKFAFSVGLSGAIYGIISRKQSTNFTLLSHVYVVDLCVDLCVDVMYVWYVWYKSIDFVDYFGLLGTF